MRLLTDFVNLTLMKHFHLYQYCLLHAREVDTVRVDVTLEEPSARGGWRERARGRSEAAGGGRPR